MVKKLSCLKRKTYLTIGLNVVNVFLGDKISPLGNNKNGYVKGPKDSFGEKCTKTLYVCQGKKLSNCHIQPLVPNLSLKHIKFINIFYLYFKPITKFG